MKRYTFLILLTVLMMLTSCHKGFGPEPDGKRIPRIAFLTTGAETGTGELPAGVILAQRFFNSKGAIFSIRNRDILFDPSELASYDLIIISTAAGYHDADRGYSLSFMTEAEMRNLRNWVEDGGFLVAGDNIGRNMINGVDRIVESGKLFPGNWPMADVLGVEMEERNMQGFRIEGDSGFFGGLIMKASGAEEWVLVPKLLGNFKGEVKAWWSNDSLQLPALVWNTYGKGQAVLLPSSYLLHPSNRGGIRSIEQIEGFYQTILESLDAYSMDFRLNLWPGQYRTAFTISLDAEGDSSHYEKLKSFLNQYEVPVTLFINPNLKADSISAILEGNIEFASMGARTTDFNDLNYPKSVQEIIQNKSADHRFRGFRFPYRKQSYWGMLALDNLGYAYESSIPTDQLNAISGSTHPYHLPVSSKGYYTILNLLEISPMQFDDEHFFAELGAHNPLAVEKQGLLFESYLKRFQQELILPYKGVMVYSGSVAYTFQNDTTRLPLLNCITSMQKEGNAWFASMSEISGRWNALEKLQLFADTRGKKTELTCILPDGLIINQLSIEMDLRPRTVEALKGQARIEQAHGKFYIVFDAMNGQRISIQR